MTKKLQPFIRIDFGNLSVTSRNRILTAIDEACKLERLKNLDFRPLVEPAFQKMADDWNEELLKIETLCVLCSETIQSK